MLICRRNEQRSDRCTVNSVVHGTASMNKKQVTIHKLYQEETHVAMILTQRSSNG